MTVALLGNVLQDLPELHTHTHTRAPAQNLATAAAASYHVPTMLSLMSSLWVIWTSVWKSRP